MEYYSALKRKTILMHATIWMDPEDILDWGIVQVVEHLSSKLKALSSIPSLPRKKKDILSGKGTFCMIRLI
jgi:hypothetical protein